ncbi:tetraacyldisaccharide 4'-kinase [Ramlibacter ginsenosidimutans]|uniref:Tetraacyldisaccharide 4'-kinase n=1 Tax=Ramlibacter ginsenosidimutans TaxID=502333 RepID=A0A934TUM6_9BURK|nr:tetraacyldisaccharide 4'-kinase [Ramlibacter ginsenosidimutans]
MSALQRAWLRRGAVARLLYPVSLVYGALAALARHCYAAGWKHREQLPVPVIVVGNVVAGGAGKTPVVLAVLEHLAARGLAAGVVSRGHGRSARDCREVLADSAPEGTGDEPLLVRQRSGAPVFVAPRRAEAGRALLRAYPATRVIVSDDGLQHHALVRDVEICVFDARGIGNGWLLPAGPLREPWPRPVDLVLQHGHPAGVPGYAMERRLAAHAVRADGSMIALADLRGTPVHALAGIAQPGAFFTMLGAAGLTLAANHPFPDHHDFAGLSGVPAQATLLCTEKDAVKLWRIRPDAWAVPLEVRIPTAFWQEFDRLLDARLSSLHGSSPA